MSSVSRLNRVPPQISQRTNAGGRKFISSLIVPAPSHSGQRPCALLKEKRLRRIAAQPRLGHLREQVCGSRRRSRRRSPGWNAACGQWAIGPLRKRLGWIRGRSRFSAFGAACRFARCDAFERLAINAGNRHSRTSVLLPEPLTPVTTTRRFSGNLTVTFFRLCSEHCSVKQR